MEIQDYCMCFDIVNKMIIKLKIKLMIEMKLNIFHGRLTLENTFVKKWESRLLRFEYFQIKITVNKSQQENSTGRKNLNRSRLDWKKSTGKISTAKPSQRNEKNTPRKNLAKNN